MSIRDEVRSALRDHENDKAEETASGWCMAFIFLFTIVAICYHIIAYVLMMLFWTGLMIILPLFALSLLAYASTYTLRTIVPKKILQRIGYIALATTIGALFFFQGPNQLHLYTAGVKVSTKEVYWRLRNWGAIPYSDEDAHHYVVTLKDELENSPYK